MPDRQINQHAPMDENIKVARGAGLAKMSLLGAHGEFIHSRTSIPVNPYPRGILCAHS